MASCIRVTFLSLTLQPRALTDGALVSRECLAILMTRLASSAFISMGISILNGALYH